MALYELVLPKMGESVAEATIIKWVKQPGDQIDIDESVLEIATDKVDSEVPSPVSGKLVKIFFKEDEIVQVGAVIATIETEAIETQTEKPGSEQVFTPALPVEVEEHVQRDGIPDLVVSTQEEITKPVDYSNSSRFYSPLVKSMAAEEGISTEDLDKIKGTGSEGRVTKKDIIDFINSGKTVKPE
jgi:2-oxoglutarate dehydrogenase E2 component (dihydrolipoamide succinyltransferase)